MLRDRLQLTLRHLGIDDSNYKVLKLLPLVYVAWSAGTLTPERRQRLIELAHDRFAIGRGGERVLQSWLDRRPDAAYFREGLRDLVLLSYAPDEWSFEVDELPGLLAHAEAIARTSALNMDAPTAVTPAEEAALREVASELGIDDGESWAALVRELEAPAVAT